jgi:uracil-DNA glycosylase
MADLGKLARQWLETDAALGVSEVPVPPQPTRLAKPVTAAEPKAFATRIPAAESPPPARPAAQTPPAQPPQQTALIADLAPIAPRKAASQKTASVLPAPAGNVYDLPPITRQQKGAALQMLLEEIQRESAGCINDISTRVVFGEGDPDAALMFVGEGPGAEEDRTGRPFVGRSGQLLDKMIAAIGYKREQVYICNVVKLRCADWAEGAYGARLQDRPPNPDEVARGLPYLHRQIEIIRPKVIVTLGAPAVKHLTGTTEGVMKIRGTWLSYRGIPVMPTYHPSFVLRAYTEENRRKVWSDLKEAVQRIKGG